MASDADRAAFAQAVSAQTGIPAGWLYSWTFAENTDTSVDRRPWNWLNLKDSPGFTYSGVKAVSYDPATDGGYFPGFGSLADAVAETVNRIKQPFARGIAAAGRGGSFQDFQQAVASSGWGTGNFAFRSLPAGGGGGIVGGIESTAGGIGKGIASGAEGALGGIESAGGAIAGGAASAGKAILGGIEAPANLAEAIIAIAKEIVHVIEWPFENWDRALEVVGGFVLLMAGLIIIGKRLAGSGPVEDVSGAVQSVAQPVALAATGGRSAAAQRSGRQAARRKHVRSAAEHSERQRLRHEQPLATRRPVAMQKVSIPGPAAREKPARKARAASSPAGGDDIPF